MMLGENLSIDIFCKVIDNFGDIGVCWRLARQLQGDYGCDVRLIVDGLNPFKAIAPEIDSLAESQTLNKVRILRWDDDTLARHYTRPSQCVIEAFGCSLPPSVIKLMVSSEAVWIDLEYLSAEDWVEGCHAIPSWHPETGLNKTLFFPGFTDRTGGIIRESNLIAHRNLFLNSEDTQNKWRLSHNLPPLDPDTIDISLFCYPDAPIESLSAAIRRSGRRVRLFTAIDINLPEDLEIYRIKFLEQEDFDRFLWTCDINFVRGEDSLVRALWSGKPLIWHIYRQNQESHMPKLGAFLKLYTAKMDQDCRETLEKFTVLWNERGRIKPDQPEPDDPEWLERLNRISAATVQWTENLARQDDLARRLVDFIRQQITNSKKDQFL